MNLRIVSIVLALIFLASGGAKLLALDFEIEAFERWGYSLALMYAIGVLEVAGGIGLLVHRLSALASTCLAALMIGAVSTHVMHDEWVMFVVAAAVMALAAWRGWAGRDDIRALFRPAAS